MKRIFLRITLLACIGLIFSVGLIFTAFGANVQNPKLYAADPSHVVTIESNVTLLNNDLIRTRVVSPGLTPAEYTGAQSFDIVQGSVISIFTRSDSSFDFQNITTEGLLSGEIEFQSALELRFAVNRNIKITVNFNERIVSEKLLISGLNGNLDVPLGNTVRLSINDTEIAYGESAVHIEKFQTLNSITFDGIAGYRLDDISIKLKFPHLGNRFESFAYKHQQVEGSSRTFIFDQVFNTDFFNYYLSVNSEIIIVLNLTKLYGLNVVVPNQGMGSYTVHKILPDMTLEAVNLSENNYFDSGTKFKITAVPKAHHTFQGFDRAPLSGNTLDITLLDNRTVNLHFSENTYQLISNLDVVTSTPTSTYSVGQTVVFTYDVKANRSIKEWRINGDKLGKGKFTGAKRNGNSITVTLTGDMLKDGKFDFKHNVKDSLRTGIVLGVSIPSLILLLLVAILAVFVYINLKRKKVIKAQLVQERQGRMVRDVGGYISDLRDGRITSSISKEDVKNEMKKQKEQK